MNDTRKPVRVGSTFRLRKHDFVFNLSTNLVLSYLPKPKGMESLSETTWDVLISGTGLQQSLLALWVSISATLDKNEGGLK
jgi:hypothetical protein